ncbi:VF530 family DNA-binding protein [bacterium]|nr:VF530 family DNA-binding protein [bacterium]
MSRTPHQILQGVTLEAMLKELIVAYEFRGLARAIPIRCFMFEPTLVSSLRFLRKNLEARAQVEAFYVAYKQQS